MTINNALLNKATLAAVPAMCSPNTQSYSHISRQSGTSYEPTDMFGRKVNRKRIALAEAEHQSSPLKWVTWPSIQIDETLPSGRDLNWVNHIASFKNSQTICLYIAICNGLCTLAKNSRLTLSKIGISRRIDVNARMMELNTDNYGSICRVDNHLQQNEGFANWEPVRLPLSTELDYPSPVEQLPRSLLITLPSSLSVEAFDTELKRSLSSCILDNWIQTQDGQIHLARHNIDPDTLKRFTTHCNADGTIRLKQSEEIYIFRKQEHTDRLVKAIERIIAEHLMSR